MNQTSLIGRPLSKLVNAAVGFAEKRGVWTYGQSNDASLARSGFWGSNSTSSTGINVTEATALTYSVFWACVNNISTDVASLPLFLYKTLPNGGKEKLKTHKLYRILHDEPNPEMDSMTFRRVLQSHVLTWGNGYAEIVRDGQGGVAQLWPIVPSRVSVKRDDFGRLFYEVSRENGRGMDRLAPENMFHIYGLGYDGTMGYSVVAMARQAIGLGMAAESFGETFFGNGASFGGVISLKTALTEQSEKSFREKMQAQHGGVEKAHKFLLLGNDATYARLGIPPNDAQFLETRQHQVEELCRIFRMPPHKIQHLLRSTNNNIEHQGIEYGVDTIRPWCVCWEHAIRRKLIAPSERLIQSAEHKMDALYRGDGVSRSQLYASGRQWGYYSVNDIREMENLNPIPEGDVYLSPQNMAPADRLDDIIDKQVEPTPAPVVAPNAEEPKASEDMDRAREMVAQIRSTLVDVEAKVAEHVARAVEAETRTAITAQENATIQAEADQHRQAAEAALAHADALKASLLMATQRADQLERDHAVAQLEAAAQADALKREAEEAAALATQRQAELATTRAQATQLDIDRMAMEQTAVAAEGVIAQLRAQLAEAQTAHAEITAAEAEAITQAKAELAHLQAQVESTQRTVAMLEAEQASLKADAVEKAAAMAAAHQEREQARADLERATKDAEVASQSLIDTTAKWAEEASARTDTAAELTARRKAEADRMQALLPAQRDLAIDILRRLVRVDCDRARRNQGTPAKLKAWAEAYFLQVDDRYLDALRAFMRAHLIFVASTEDVDAYTTKLVTPQLADAEKQIRTIADGDPEDFPASLERLLTKWEQERPAAIADRVFQEEMSYVRSL